MEKKYIITAGDVNAVVAVEATTLRGAKSQHTKLRKNYKTIKIWERVPGSMVMKPYLIGLRPDGSSTGDMAPIDTFDSLL